MARLVLQGPVSYGEEGSRKSPGTPSYNTRVIGERVGDTEALLLSDKAA